MGGAEDNDVRARRQFLSRARRIAPSRFPIPDFRFPTVRIAHRALTVHPSAR